MEPWPPSHGYNDLAQGGHGGDRSFNGAMASQPWIRGPVRSINHCSALGFNGAMASQPWILCSLALPFLCFLCFNGAMASQPWIRGTRPCCRRRTNCFNGAMASQPWIRRIYRDYSPNLPRLHCNLRIQSPFHHPIATPVLAFPSL